MGYDAFISYSHDTDGERAKAIEDGLERLAKPWHRRRSLNVFRDSSGLSANPGLWTSIADVMEQSEWLVILCSPESAASPWVGREIEHWIATKPEGRILPVLTAGELVWDEDTGTFDPTQSTAANAALAAGFAEEPLWVDMRFADNADARTLHDPRFQNAIAALAAPMHGLAKDELIGEDIRQHRRTLRFAWAAVIALLVLALGTLAGAATAYNKANEANRYADQVVAANQSLADLRVEQASAQQQLDSTNAQLDSANTDLAQAKDETAQANAATTQANAQATAASGERDQANVDRDTARGESVAFRGLADAAQVAANEAQANEVSARGSEHQALLSAADAARAQQDAIVAKQEAVLAADQAKRDEQIAIDGKKVADQQSAHAAAEAARQGRIAQATQLATESARAEVRDSKADLSLLLSVEAASIDPALVAPAAGSGLSALAENQRTVVPDAHGALVSAVTAASGVEGFLHFGCRVPMAPPCPASPQKLGKVAVSPDGKFVAAVEDSQAIQLGEAKARLFVWSNADDFQQAEVHELSQDLACLVDLQWAMGDVLVTVEAPTGCLNPIEIKVPTNDQVVNYQVSITKVWDPWSSNPGQNLCLGGTVSLEGRSPVVLSPDRRFVTVNCLDHVSSDGDPIALGLVLDAPSVRNPDSSQLHLDLIRTNGIGLSISPLGGYAYGWSEDSQANTLLKLDWVSESLECPFGCFPQQPIVDPEFDLFIGIEFGAPAPGASERFVTASVRDADPRSVTPHAVAVFDVTNGERQALIDIPDGVVGAALAYADEILVVSDETGHLQFFSWRDEQKQAVVPLPPGWGACEQRPNDLPSVSRGGSLLFLERFCSVEQNAVLVLDMHTGAILRELRGTLKHSSADDRYVVTEQFDVVKKGDSELPRFGYELWDFGPRLEAAVGDPVNAGTLLDHATDVRPLVSDDGTLVATVPASIVSDDTGVTLWRLASEGPHGPSRLPGSVGTRAVAYAGPDRLVGVGRMGAAVQWNPNSTPYDELYDDPTPAYCRAAGSSKDTTNNLQRSAVSTDLGLRAVSSDAHSVEIVDRLNQGRGRSFELALAADERVSNFFFSPTNDALLVNIERSNGRCRGGAFTGSMVVPLAVPGAAEIYRGEVVRAAGGDGSRLLFVRLDGSEVVVRAGSDRSVIARVNTSTLQPPADDLVGNLFALDPTGTLVAGTNSTGRTIVWETATNGVVFDDPAVVQPTSDLTLLGLRFSPDGSKLAVKTVDQKLRIYDAHNRHEVKERQLPTDAGARVMYSPDGGIVAVDGVYMFDSLTLRPIGGKIWPSSWDDPTRDRGSQASWFVQQDDGLYLVLERTFDTSAVRLRVDVGGLRETACDLAGRNLSKDEFSLYLPDQAYRETCSS